MDMNSPIAAEKIKSASTMVHFITNEDRYRRRYSKILPKRVNTFRGAFPIFNYNFKVRSTNHHCVFHVLNINILEKVKDNRLDNYGWNVFEMEISDKYRLLTNDNITPVNFNNLLIKDQKVVPFYL